MNLKSTLALVLGLAFLSSVPTAADQAVGNGGGISKVTAGANIVVTNGTTQPQVAVTAAPSFSGMVTGSSLTASAAGAGNDFLRLGNNCPGTSPITFSNNGSAVVLGIAASAWGNYCGTSGWIGAMDTSGNLALKGRVLANGMYVNTVGGGGQNDELLLYDTTASAANPYKGLRVSSGCLQVTNSAFNAVPFSVCDNGNLTAAGTGQFTGNVTLNGNYSYSWNGGEAIADDGSGSHGLNYWAATGSGLGHRWFLGPASGSTEMMDLSPGSVAGSEVVKWYTDEASHDYWTWYINGSGNGAGVGTHTLQLWYYPSDTTNGCCMSAIKIVPDQSSGHPTLSTGAGLIELVEQVQIDSTKTGVNGASALVIPNGDITTARGNNTGVVYLGNSGNHYVYFDGTNYQLPNGAVYATAFVNNSKRSLKHDIHSIKGLDAINLLKNTCWASFRYKTGPQDTHYGFVADCTPSILSGPNKDHFDAETTSTIDALAILQQQDEIATLQARVQQLEQEVALRKSDAPKHSIYWYIFHPWVPVN